MNGVVDLFIAKDRTTIFWFVMACAAIFGSAYFANTVITEVKKKPQYVIMDGNGIYYLAPSVEFERAKELHLAQTRLAMETLFTRGPGGLEYKKRVDKLFMDNVIDKIKTDIMKPEAATFAGEKVDQTIELEPPELTGITAKTARTHAKGILHRKGTFKGQPLNETWTVEGTFLWRINARMGDNGWFPSLCTDMKTTQSKIAGK